MPVERFYIDAEFQKGHSVNISGAELHHLANVIRLRVGEEAELINGRGGLCHAKLIQQDKRSATFEILASENIPSHPHRTTGVIPLMRPAKLEWIIEKGTELGVDAFFFYVADRSEKDSLSEHQIERLHFLSLAALKQSGRLFLPSIQILPSLKEVFQHAGQFYFGDTRSDAQKFQIRNQSEPIYFITGPESGFSEKEVQLLDEKALGVKLSSHILRAETAPLVAFSAFSLHFL